MKAQLSPWEALQERSGDVKSGGAPGTRKAHNLKGEQVSECKTASGTDAAMKKRQNADLGWVKVDRNTDQGSAWMAGRACPLGNDGPSLTKPEANSQKALCLRFL